jgi:hypothetical protein
MHFSPLTKEMEMKRNEFITYKRWKYHFTRLSILFSWNALARFGNSSDAYAKGMYTKDMHLITVRLGRDCVSVELRPLTGPLSIRRWHTSSGGTILTGENQITRRKTCPNATLSTTNTTWTNHSANSGLRGEKLKTDRLSHGNGSATLYISTPE